MRGTTGAQTRVKRRVERQKIECLASFSLPTYKIHHVRGKGKPKREKERTDLLITTPSSLHPHGWSSIITAADQPVLSCYYLKPEKYADQNLAIPHPEARQKRGEGGQDINKGELFRDSVVNSANT